MRVERAAVRAAALSLALLAAEAAVPTPVAAQEKWYGSLLFDQLEYRWTDGPDLLRWDVEGWVGTDYDRIWIRSEGDRRTTGRSGGEAEAQLLYSRLIAPFWELQAGVRHQLEFGSGTDQSRTFLAVGFEGMAPYWFDVEPSLFVSDDGDVSARVAATYDVFLTQRLIAQPRFEVNLALQEVEEFGVGAGLNDIELALRLRYEIRREVAPYLGVSWVRAVGETAGLRRREEGDADELAFVLGVRLWF